MSKTTKDDILDEVDNRTIGQDSEEVKTEEKPDKNECECENCECDKEVQNEFKDKYFRALADYQNLNKRIEREREESRQQVSQWIIQKFLTVLDDLELAKQNLKDKGIELIHDKFWKLLEKEGVQKIEIKENDEFNPKYMECIEAQEAGKKLIEVRAGYIMKEKVIRPTQVRVIK